MSYFGYKNGYGAGRMFGYRRAGGGGAFTPAAGGVTIVNAAMSNLSVSNRLQHDYSYAMASSSQDGTTALLVVFFGDVGSEDFTPNKGTKLHGTTLGGSGQVAFLIYVPDAGEFAAQQVNFSYTTASVEVYQFLVYELKGLNLSALPASVLVDTVADESNDDRPTVGPGTLDAGVGDLMVVGCSMDDQNQPTPLTVQTANGFSHDFNYAPPNGASVLGIGGFQFGTRVADSAGTFNTPVYANAVSEEMLMVGVTLKAA